MLRRWSTVSKAKEEQKDNSVGFVQWWLSFIFYRLTNSRSFSSPLVPSLHLKVPELTHLHLVSNWNIFFSSTKMHFSDISHFREWKTPSLMSSPVSLSVSTSFGVLLSIFWIHPLFFVFTSVSLIQAPIVFAHCLPLWPQSCPLASTPCTTPQPNSSFKKYQSSDALPASNHCMAPHDLQGESSA